MKLMFSGRKSDAASGPVNRPPPRTTFLESLHLVVLTTFAVTQPVYDRLGTNPVFLSDSGVDPPGVLLLVLLLSAVIPGGVAALVWAIGRFVPRSRSAVYSLALFVLAAFIALPVTKRIEFLLPYGLVIGPALLVAAAATWGYFAFRPLRSVITAGAIGVVAFPLLFLFLSPVSSFSGPPTLRTERWKPVPVVMVVFDEFRGTSLLNEQGEIDAGRFPHFAELARGSTRYRQATTVHHETLYAVPALLSGMYPTTLIVPRPAELPQNLFSVLESTGAFEQAIFEPVSKLASERVKTSGLRKKPAPIQAAAVVPTLARVFLVHLTPGNLQRYLPEIPPLWFGLHPSEEVDRSKHRGVFRYFWGKDRREQFEHFLECIEDSPNPALYFSHVLLPHVPWCYLPSGQRYLAESNRWELLDFDTHGGLLDCWGTDELYLVQSQQRQLLQLQYCDQLVGRLLDRLRETGLYDQCLLVVTADHGLSFAIGESRRYPTAGNLADIMSIPLFVKLPGQQSGDVNDRNVESIDVLPTITDVLGIRMQLPTDGSSMLDTTLPERAGKTMYRSRVPTSVPATVLSDSGAGQELRSRFGPSSDPDVMYRIGPHSELIGRSVNGLTRDNAPPVELELIRSGTFYSADRGVLVPCFIEGRVVAPAGIEMPVRLAVAVNGVVQATTRTYFLDGLRNRWAAMVPEAAFHEGENDVRYYVISGEGPELRLTPCRASVVAAGL